MTFTLRPGAAVGALILAFAVPWPIFWPEKVAFLIVEAALLASALELTQKKGTAR